MYRIFFTLSLLFFTLHSNAQELNCDVVVAADKVTTGNDQVYKTLETAIKEFVNQTIWTNKAFKIQERIDCSMVISIDKQVSNTNFSGSIQVFVSRPVYNSAYTTPLFSHKDKYFTFSYTQNEPLRFDLKNYESDLVSTISYYAYMILAIDADSFALNGGDPYYDKCRTIVSQVENQSSKDGWTSSNTKKFNRHQLVEKLYSPSNAAYRNTMYNYHINGLDKMESDKKAGKEMILNSLIGLKDIYRNTMSSNLYRVFMDAKSDEIEKIFSDGPQMDTRQLVSALNKMSPTNAQKWSNFK